MSWQWNRAAYLYRVTLRNWPDVLVEKKLWPKNGFKLKKISDGVMRSMTQALEMRFGVKRAVADDEEERDEALLAVEIVPWTDGEYNSTELLLAFVLRFIQRKKLVRASSKGRYLS